MHYRSQTAGISVNKHGLLDIREREIHMPKFLLFSWHSTVKTYSCDQFRLFKRTVKEFGKYSEPRAQN